MAGPPGYMHLGRPWCLCAGFSGHTGGAPEARRSPGAQLCPGGCLPECFLPCLRCASPVQPGPACRSRLLSPLFYLFLRLSREEISLTAAGTGFPETGRTAQSSLSNHLETPLLGTAVLPVSHPPAIRLRASGETWVWRMMQPLQKLLESGRLSFLGAVLWGGQGAEGEAGPTGLASAP